MFFRHLWLNLLPLLFMLVAAVVFLLQPVYVSRATIYIQDDTLLDNLIQIRIRDQPFNGVQLLTPAQVAARELEELAKTDAFVYAVIAESDLRDQLTASPRDERRVLKLFRDSFFVEADGDSLVVFHVEAERPELAYQWATATVKAYRLWKISRDVQDGKIAAAFFEEILTPYQDEVDRANAALRDYLEQYPEPAVGQRPVEEAIELKRLQDAVALAEERLKSVLDKQESARLALAQTERDVDQTYKLIDEPKQPPIAEPFWYHGLLALVFPGLGIILSIFLVLGRAALDQTLLLPRDVTEELELPVLATVERGRKPQARQRRSTSAAAPRADDAVGGPARA
jgi:capsular polysaccharide biosynthesis protein